MTTIGARLLDLGFGHPRGVLGRIGGRLMARGNAATERHLVEVSDLAVADEVLVLGPGPGVGLAAAAARSRRVVGVDPSETMLSACRARCSKFIAAARVDLVRGDAEHTGQRDCSVDVVIAVNNVQLWPDAPAGLTELHRVLRPGGRLLLSAHQKWLPGGLDALAARVSEAGFADVRTWNWEPPGRGAGTAAQLSAVKPPVPGSRERG